MSGKTVSDVSTTLSFAPSGTGDGGADGRNSGVSLATTRLNAPYAGIGGSTGMNERGSDRSDVGMGLQSVARTTMPSYLGPASHGMEAFKQGQSQAQQQGIQQRQVQAQVQQAHHAPLLQRQQVLAPLQAHQAHSHADLFHQQQDRAPARAQQAYNHAQVQQAYNHAQAKQAYNHAQAQQQADARARAQQDAKAEKKREQLQKKRVASDDYRKGKRAVTRSLIESVSRLKEEKCGLSIELREMAKENEKLREENGKLSRTKNHLNREIDRLRSDLREMAPK